MVAVFGMMFRIPMANPSPDLTDKVEAALLSQVSEIASQVCNGMLVTGAAAPLKNRDGLGGPRTVVGFISHAPPSKRCYRTLIRRLVAALVASFARHIHHGGTVA